MKQDDDSEDPVPESAAIHVSHAHIEPPATLKFSSQTGYDVTVGDIVRVARGRYYDYTGIVLNVDFCKASMEIQCNGFRVGINFLLCYFLPTFC